MVGIVDDSNGSTNDFQPQTQLPLPVMLEQMQEDAQLWNDLLYCSGGQLELTKCSFHVLHFEFKPNGRPCPSKSYYHNRIRIHDSHTGAHIPIKSLRADQAHKTRGHYKSPADPKQKTQLA